jgi:hypothetical protein
VQKAIDYVLVPQVDLPVIGHRVPLCPVVEAAVGVFFEQFVVARRGKTAENRGDLRATFVYPGDFVFVLVVMDHVLKLMRDDFEIVVGFGVAGVGVDIKNFALIALCLAVRRKFGLHHLVTGKEVTGNIAVVGVLIAILDVEHEQVDAVFAIESGAGLIAEVSRDYRVNFLVEFFLYTIYGVLFYTLSVFNIYITAFADGAQDRSHPVELAVGHISDPELFFMAQRSGRCTADREFGVDVGVRNA